MGKENHSIQIELIMWNGNGMRSPMSKNKRCCNAQTTTYRLHFCCAINDNEVEGIMQFFIVISKKAKHSCKEWDKDKKEWRMNVKKKIWKISICIPRFIRTTQSTLLMRMYQKLGHNFSVHYPPPSMTRVLFITIIIIISYRQHVYKMHTTSIHIVASWLCCKWPGLNRMVSIF